jgi:hypothetical protein
MGLSSLFRPTGRTRATPTRDPREAAFAELLGFVHASLAATDGTARAAPAFRERSRWYFCGAACYLARHYTLSYKDSLALALATLERLGADPKDERRFLDLVRSGRDRCPAAREREAGEAAIRRWMARDRAAVGRLGTLLREDAAPHAEEVGEDAVPRVGLATRPG